MRSRLQNFLSGAHLELLKKRAPFRVPLFWAALIHALQIRFEFAAFFHPPMWWVKKRGNFKINLFFDQIVLFLNCLCSRAMEMKRYCAVWISEFITPLWLFHHVKFAEKDMKHTNYQFSESYCTLLPNNLYLKNTEEDNCTMYVLAYHDNPKRKKRNWIISRTSIAPSSFQSRNFKSENSLDHRETVIRNAMDDIYFRLVTLAWFCLVISPPS